MQPSDVLLTALKQVMDPELGRNVVDLNMIRDLEISTSGKVSFTLTLTVPSCPLRNKMAEDARQALLALPEVSSVEIRFGAMTDQERREVLGQAAQPALPQLNHLNRIQNTIAIMSGKGGVGKSSVTAMLAVSLTRRGFKVGILDADITGPSIPKLFGLPAGGLRSSPLGMLPAVTSSGIKVVSTNLLLKEDDTPVIWRGPMISSTIQQFWAQSLWGKLDYLLVDLPPGTSDAAIAVTQSLPLDRVVLVTTPQELAALVVRKAVHMLQKMDIPIIGIIENMSYFCCPDTGKRHEIFGPSHADEIAAASGAVLSARLPIEPQVAILADAGRIENVTLEEIETLLEKLTLVKEPA